MPKIKSLTTRTGVSLALSLAVGVVLLLELAAAYLYWYGNLLPQEPTAAPGNVVRVDLTGYRQVVEYLDQVEAYVPDGRAGDYGNPFLYR